VRSEELRVIGSELRERAGPVTDEAQRALARPSQNLDSSPPERRHLKGLLRSWGVGRASNPGRIRGGAPSEGSPEVEVKAKPAPGLLSIEHRCHQRPTRMPDGAADSRGREHPSPAPDGRNGRLGRPGPQCGPGIWMAWTLDLTRFVESRPF
jgi:hypothetical protein